MPGRGAAVSTELTFSWGADDEQMNTKRSQNVRQREQFSRIKIKPGKGTGMAGMEDGFSEGVTSEQELERGR